MKNIVLILIMTICFLEVSAQVVPIHLLRVEDSTRVGQMIAVMPDNDQLDTVFHFVPVYFVNDSTMMVGNDTVITSANAAAFDLGGGGSGATIDTFYMDASGRLVLEEDAVSRVVELDNYYVSDSELIAAIAASEAGDGDRDATNELQGLGYDGTNNEITINGGTNADVSALSTDAERDAAIAASEAGDGDRDATNELQNWLNLPGIPINIDEDSTDDFSGNYDDLTNKPTLSNLNYWTQTNNNIFYKLGGVSIGTNFTKPANFIVDIDTVNIRSNIVIRRKGGGNSINGMGVLSAFYKEDNTLNNFGILRGGGSWYLGYGVKHSNIVSNGFVSSSDDIAAWRSVMDVGAEFVIRNYGGQTITPVGDPITLKTRFIVKTDGDVGVNTFSPSVRFEVAGDTKVNSTYKFMLGNISNNVYLKSPSTGFLGLYTSNINRLSISGSGNVGVGTTSPSTKLDVNGTIRQRTQTNYTTTTKFAVFGGTNDEIIGYRTFDPSNVNDADSDPNNELQGLTYNTANRTIGLSATPNAGVADFFTTATDGAGSGLDSDFLDGQQGSYYLDYNNLQNTPTITASPWLTSGNNAYRSSGLIGIGTSSPNSKITVFPAATERTATFLIRDDITEPFSISQGFYNYFAINSTTGSRSVIVGADNSNVADCITTEIEYNLETKNEVVHHIQNAKTGYGNELPANGTTQVERRNAAFVDADFLTTTYLHIELEAQLNSTIHENYLHIAGQWGGFGIDAIFRLRMQTGNVVGVLSTGDTPPLFEVEAYVSGMGKPVIRMRINGGTLEDTTFPLHIQRGTSQNGLAEDCPAVSRIVFNTGSNI